MKCVLRFVYVAFALLLGGCGGGGSSAPPPSEIKVAPGDTSAIVSWNKEQGTEYWLWLAAGNDVTPSNCAVTAACKIYVNVSSPFIITGLTNGTMYSVTINAAEPSRRDVHRS